MNDIYAPHYRRADTLISLARRGATIMRYQASARRSSAMAARLKSFAAPAINASERRGRDYCWTIDGAR